MLRINDKVVFREVDDKIILINLESGFYYSLNEIGCFIFKRILKNKNPCEILEEIKHSFDVSEEKADQDLGEFLDTLTRENIVVQYN
jgi:hypothetical protein